MSLDLYITSKTPIRKRGTGVYVRENGETRELKHCQRLSITFLMQMSVTFKSMYTKLTKYGMETSPIT